MKVYILIVAVLAFLTTLPEAGAWELSRRTVDCRVTAWSEWSTSGGSDTMTRERAILRHPSGGGTPCPTLKETKETICRVAPWSEWSTSGGSDTMTRERAILRHPSGGGTPCPTLKETKETICRIAPWSEWGPPEGFGTRKRERSIRRYPLGGGPPLPETKETKCSVTSSSERNHHSSSQSLPTGGDGGSIQILSSAAFPPSGGGSPSPVLQETQETNQLPSPKQTAVSILKRFIRRGANLEQPRRAKRQDQATGAVRDLLIIVDSSGSIGSTDFTIAKHQLGHLLGLLCPYPDPFRLNKPYHRAALLQYSSQVKEEFDFHNKTGLSEIQRSIENMQYMNGRTCTAAAFEKAQDMFSPEKGMRNGRQVDVVREVLILTDGQSSGCKGASAVKAALNLKKDLSINATVFGLAIGKFYKKGREEILSYVSKPAPEHVFAFPDFRTLTRVLNQVDELVSGITDRCHPFDFER